MLGYQMLTPSLSHGYSLTVTTSSNPTIIATVILPWSVWGQIRGDTCSVRKKQRCWPRISTQAFSCARSLRKLDSTGRSVLCGRKQRVWGLYKNWGLQCSLVFEDVVTTPEQVSLGGSCSLITTSRQVSWLLWPSVPLSVKWEFYSSWPHYRTWEILLKGHVHELQSILSGT